MTAVSRENAAPPAAPATPVDLLYLGGIGRSGSTLIERLLGEVGSVCSLGEVMFLWSRGIEQNELCGCGTRFHECPFWTAVGIEAFGGWDAVDTGRMAQLARRVDDVKNIPRLLRPGHGSFAADLAEYVAAYEAVYRAARTVTGRRVVVDSSKSTSLAYCLRTSKTLRLRLLHLVRDSRGVAYSWTRVVSRPEASDESVFMPRFSPARVAVLWSGHNVLLELPRLAGTPTRLVRYEDFVVNPRALLADILDFADVAVTDESLAAAHPDAVDLGVSHQVAGNPMRYQTGHIVVANDQKWRTLMPTRQRRLVTVVTAPVAAALGYRPGTGRATRG